ncbi:hypothetical protein WH95_16375 [Kiloniella litopenaei]|uniref:Reverse transcriptase domain-containing protein n=1 Tax=Kiloniella litopenaei TaxID=1549748 RepID=A0A0M2R8E6_9PROT|nr:antiviral reverse transcriptase Drt3a [Kiloniella litopenaei]KKJ75803.1 hypothetical protein WH95_16375 [Kiloniella litopenaei]
MLDQSFSPKNFRKIFDIENRKGNYLEKRFFPELLEITQEVQRKKNEYENHKSKKNELTAEEYIEDLEALGEELRQLKEQREAKIGEELEKISDEALHSDLDIKIKEIDIGMGKAAYTIEDKAVSYFTLRQVQYNIRRIYKVKQSNRHHIICQLRELLSDKFPKYIVKTDIVGFYENIPRDQLISKINGDPYLSISTKKIIKKVLYEYGKLSGSPKGIPRGIGLSAYLSELYMRKLDMEIYRFPGVIYYARYVDDIIFIFCPPANGNPIDVGRFFQTQISSLKLEYNSAKTRLIRSHPSNEFFFEYLGYKIQVDAGNVSIGLSEKKKTRYKTRINLAFSDYLYSRKNSERQSRKLLVNRLKFLAANTRLVNNKKNVVSGIYFSNPLICKKGIQDLKELDDHLKSKTSVLQSKYLKSTIFKQSFIEGFEKIRFYKFKPSELEQIVEVWKYVR